MKYPVCLLASILIAGPAFAEKTYQVTGPVVELTDTSIVVQKGKEKWEIARSASTPVKGELQKGAKVTVEYTMSATNIEVKPGKAK
jgi:hypothetical protein